ncbi:hypothetical protein Taro_018658 [Colocasia esculenta]|uniref:Uncharacterized protein n=1 Tax=Colocasia esculenta TaxID=4460 RepID=A0A843URC0_COLES|nr:hypothetical protein [Colocasia esculenta]
MERRDVIKLGLDATTEGHPSSCFPLAHRHSRIYTRPAAICDQFGGVHISKNGRRQKGGSERWVRRGLAQDRAARSYDTASPLRLIFF